MGRQRKARARRGGISVQKKRVKRPKKPTLADAPEVMKSHWDHKMTLKKNFKAMGLVLNPNEGSVIDFAPREMISVADAHPQQEFISKEQLELLRNGNKKMLQETTASTLPEEEEFDWSQPKTAGVVFQTAVGSKVLDGKETEVVKELALNAHMRPTHVKALAPAQVDVVRKFLKKHGVNYVKMARDMRLNVYQHTPEQIRKMAEEFRKEGHSVDESVDK